MRTPAEVTIRRRSRMNGTPGTVRASVDCASQSWLGVWGHLWHVRTCFRRRSGSAPGDWSRSRSGARSWLPGPWPGWSCCSMRTGLCARRCSASARSSASSRLRRSEQTDWLSLARSQVGFDGLHHLVIIPTYKEDDAVLAETLDYLVRQDFPAERVAVVLAFEARDGGAPSRAARLLARYRSRFGKMWALFHQIQPGEVAGKSSNLAWAASACADAADAAGDRPGSRPGHHLRCGLAAAPEVPERAGPRSPGRPRADRPALSAGAAVPREPGSAAAAAPRDE